MSSVSPHPPTKELNRFLYGLDSQGYDGYRDPRIILSNERKKFPNEVLPDTARAVHIAGFHSPTRTAGVAAPVGDAVADGEDIVGGRDNDGEFVEGDVLNSPGCLKSSSPLKPKEPRPGGAGTDRNVVAAAAEKLSELFDLSEMKPLYWLKRGQGMSAPPSPPPPTSETSASPQRASSEKQVAESKACAFQSPNSLRMSPDQQVLVFPARHWHGGSPINQGDLEFPSHDTAHYHQGFGMPHLLYLTPQVSPSGKPENILPPHGNMSPTQTENTQELFGLKQLICTCAKMNAGNEISPDISIKYFNNLRRPDVKIADGYEFPKASVTCEESRNPSSPDIHPQCPMPQAVSPSPALETGSEFKDVAVCHILDRISNMERLLAQQISAEKGILTQCLLEIQKLLRLDVIERETGKNSTWKESGQENGRSSADKEDKEMPRDQMRTEYRPEEISDGQRISFHGESGSSKTKCCQGDNEAPLFTGKKKRTRRNQTEKVGAKKSTGKKSVCQPAKNSADIHGKDLKTDPEEAPAPGKNQQPQGKELKRLDRNKDDPGRAATCGEYFPLTKDVTTSSCSSTGPWEDLASSSAPMSHHGKPDIPRCREEVQTGDHHKEKDGHVQEDTKDSHMGEVSQQRQLSSSPGSGYHQQNYQYSEMIERKLRKSFEQAQRAMLHMMIERLNVHLLKVSALASFDTTSSDTCQQQESKDQNCEEKLALKELLVSTEPSTAPPTCTEVNDADAVLTREQSKGKIYKEITTQTYDIDNPSDLPKRNPEITQQVTNETSHETYLPEFGVEPLIAITEGTQNTECTDRQSVGHLLLRQHKSAFRPVHKAKDASEKTPIKQAQQNLLLSEGHLLDNPIVKQVSPQKTHLTFSQLYARPSSATEFRLAAMQNVQPKNVENIQTKVQLLQHGIECPQLLQSPQTEPILLKQQQQKANLPRVLFSLPVQNRDDQTFENVVNVCSNEPAVICNNFLWDGLCEGDSQTPHGRLQIGHYYPCHPQTELFEQSGQYQHEFAGHNILSPLHQDQVLQPTQWPGQQNQHYQQQQQQQQQSKTEQKLQQQGPYLLYQNVFEENVCPEQQLGSHTTYWLPHQDQEPQHLQHPQVDGQNYPQLLQVNHLNNPHEANSFIPERIPSCPKPNLPNSCPTVPFAGNRCVPLSPVQNWTPACNSNIWPTFSPSGASPFGASRNGSVQKNLPKRADLCMQPQPLDHAVCTKPAATDRAVCTQPHAPDHAVCTQPAAPDRAVCTQPAAPDRAVCTQPAAPDRAVCTQPAATDRAVCTQPAATDRAVCTNRSTGAQKVCAVYTYLIEYEQVSPKP